MSDINTVNKGFLTMIPSSRKEEEKPRRRSIFSLNFRLFSLEFRISLNTLSNRS